MKVWRREPGGKEKGLVVLVGVDAISQWAQLCRAEVRGEEKGGGEQPSATATQPRPHQTLEVLLISSTLSWRGGSALRGDFWPKGFHTGRISRTRYSL